MNRESLSINVFVYITQLGVIYNGARVVVTHLGGFAKEGSFSADFAKQRSCLLFTLTVIDFTLFINDTVNSI